MLVKTADSDSYANKYFDGDADTDAISCLKYFLF